MADESQNRYTSIPVSPATAERLKSKKRGDESWDDFLQKMDARYDPDEHAPELTH